MTKHDKHDKPKKFKLGGDGRIQDRYERNARVLRVVDGDTLELMVDLGFEHWYRGKFRLAGIDTPEKFGVKKGSDEYIAGVAASEYVLNWLLANADRETFDTPLGPVEFLTIVIRSFDAGKEKYGRWICEVFSADGGGVSLNLQLVAAGHAVEVDY